MLRVSYFTFLTLPAFGLSAVIAINNTSGSFRDFPSTTNVCGSLSLSGIDWLLSQRNENYGWGEETHRATIALAVNKFKGQSDTEINLMKYQLEVELSKALLRNNSRVNGDGMTPSDVSLYIHALVATGRDPKDFYGKDLVSHLETSVTNTRDPNPFQLLALCNARSLTSRHVQSIHHRIESLLSSNGGLNTDLFAIAVKALACAVDEGFNGYKNHLQHSANVLVQMQNTDGGFGNIYTTSLVMQALVASDIIWDESSALNYLRDRKLQALNLVSVYMMEMALNARSVPFVKQLAPRSEPVSENGFPTVAELLRWPRTHNVQYSIKVGEYPDIYHTVTMKVPANTTFFDVMKIAAHEDPKFEFSHHPNENGEPLVYAVSGVPNDVEDGLYWRLIVEQSVPNSRSTFHEIFNPMSSVKTIDYPDAHYQLWYMNVYHPVPGTTY